MQHDLAVSLTSLLGMQTTAVKIAAMEKARAKTVRAF